MINRLTVFAAAGTIVFSTPAMAKHLAACTAVPGEAANVAGIEVENAPGSSGDLAALRVVVAASGAHMMVYYDAGSEAVARSRAACLGAQIMLLEREVADVRRGAEWASAVFTQNDAYVPPRGMGVTPRWTVPVGTNGALSDASQRKVTDIIPHEQVHAYQNRAGARLPRWFTEGHATWVALRVTPELDQTAADRERERVTAAALQPDPALNLAGWGSVRPRREAVMRQVSLEDRTRMEADPSYNPAGSFSFTSADFVGDESKMPARYAGALRVFEGLAARHGVDAVREWAGMLTSTPGHVTSVAMAESVTAAFGESLTDLLGE